MPFDTAAILAEIDDSLAAYEKVESEHSRCYAPHDEDHTIRDYIDAPEIMTAEIITTLRATLDRFGPPGYGEKALATVPNDDWESKTIRTLAGILKFSAVRLRRWQDADPPGTASRGYVLRLPGDG